MNLWLLVAAGIFFLFGCAYSLLAFRRGAYRPGRVNLAALAAGFALQSIFLYLRGQELRACPLHTLFDVLIFLSWSIVLMYLVIGPAFRLSLLGAFTAPLVLLLQVAAFVSGIPGPPPVDPPPLNPWVELHGALSVMAYGAFGLAAVSGLMYLLQERQLKRHRVSNLFYNLPPIQDLAKANGRLLILGFCLLTVAFSAGLISRLPVDGLKLWGSAVIWLFYGILLVVRIRRGLASRRIAQLSVAVFAVAIVTLPVLHYLSTPGKLP